MVDVLENPPAFEVLLVNNRILGRERLNYLPTLDIQIYGILMVGSVQITSRLHVWGICQEMLLMFMSNVAHKCLFNRCIPFLTY